MSFLSFIIDSESIEKARRALFGASILLLFFSSLNFLSDEFNFFGLRVAVSHDRLIIIGQLSVFYLMVRFLSMSASELIKWTHLKLTQVDENWEKVTVANFPSFDQEPYDGYSEDPEEWELKFSEDRKKRVLRRSLVERSYSYFNVSIGFLYNFIVPVILGMSSILEPRSLSRFLDFFASY
ncbi:MAG: hypothetical protein K9G71_19730 [Rhodobacteraceae bacterium]|nr:hypothetical protein [Paracoccaceae bacterium]MCF8516590.1 hypothetical protein [Paracoccaceae bacterium]MCF8520935.1 hypothetical protein [Paracoccaceae bacterium]